MHFDSIFFTDQTDNLSSIPPLGAYKCAQVLRDNGYTSLVVNHFSSFSASELNQLIDLAVGPNTALVGFSTTFLRSVDIDHVPGQPTPVYPELPNNTVFPQGKTFEDQAISRFREKNSAIKFVAGGARVHPEINNRNIDYVCIGYSEISVVNLMNHVVKKTPLEKSYRNIWGITVIDDRKADAYDFVNGRMQWLPFDVVNHHTLPLEVARGCVFRCKFCSFPLNGKKKLDFVRCLDVLEQELEENYSRYGITNYQIVDDTFNDHAEKLQDLSDMVSGLSFRPAFWAYHRLDLIGAHPQTLPLLHRIGVRGMFFGIETFDPVAAKIIGKGQDPQRQIATINLIRKEYPDISMMGNFIIGLPQESVASIRDSHARIVNQEIPLHHWGFMSLRLKSVSSMAFASDFELNLAKYGYVDQTPEQKIDDRFINWKSQQMTFLQARELESELQSATYQSDNLYVENQFAFRISSMGHPKYTLESILGTKQKDLNFAHIEKQVRPAFVYRYKKRLFDMIAQL